MGWKLSKLKWRMIFRVAEAAAKPETTSAAAHTKAINAGRVGETINLLCLVRFVRCATTRQVQQR